MFFRVKRRGYLLIIVWVLILLMVLSALTLLEGAFMQDSHTIASVGWAGYVVTSSFNDNQEITSISGSWLVPEVNVSNGNGYSSAWIGIGGQQDKTLIQIGTEHNVINGVAKYNAWYEMLPEYAIKIENFNVNPGDQVTASLKLVNCDLNEWNLQLLDVTTGQLFNRNFIYNSTRSSGEWVLERATVNGQISNLADYGSIRFTDCTTTVSEKQGILSDFAYSLVHMTNHQYDRLATTSELGPDNCSFIVSYAKNC